MRIHAKLLASLLGTALLPLILVAAITFTSSKNALVNMATDRLASSAHTVASNTVATLTAAVEEMAGWSKLSVLQSGMFLKEDPDLQMGLLLRDLTAVSDFLEIWCADPSGKVIAASHFDVTGSERRDDPALAAIRDNKVYVSPVHEVELGDGTTRSAITIAYPVHADFDETELVGVLVGQYDWSKVSDLLHIQQSSDRSEFQKILLLDAEGVVATSDDAVPPLHQKLSELLPGVNLAELEFSGSRGAPGMDINGNPVLRSASRVLNQEYGITFTGVTEARESVILVPVHRLERNILWVILFAILAVVVFSFFLSRRISLPIVALSNNARAIAGGDLSVPPHHDSSDEIGELSRDLDTMRINLKAHIETLDNMVASRTRELEETVQQLQQEMKEREVAEAKALLRQRQLVQADKMVSLGILVSGMAHEVNNPNGLISLNLPTIEEAWKRATPILDEYLKDEGDFSLGAMNYGMMRDEIPKLLQEMRQGSERIRRIVNDLKDFSRQGAEEGFEKVDVAEMLNTAANLVTNHIRKSTENFQLDISSALPQIRGNAQRLEQVVINLIINACQSLENSSQAIQVRAFHDQAEDAVVVEVADEGRGIAPESLPHITDPFFTTRRESGGTGLGLSVSAGIVEEHGGKLEFTSSIGQGTTALLILPVLDSSEDTHA